MPTVQDWPRDWENKLHPSIAQARSAREELARKCPSHELLGYLVYDQKLETGVVEELCGRFYPSTMTPWRKIPTGAALVVALEEYTKAVIEAAK